MSTVSRVRACRFAALALVAAVALAGCGGGEGVTSEPDDTTVRIPAPVATTDVEGDPIETDASGDDETITLDDDVLTIAGVPFDPGATIVVGGDGLVPPSWELQASGQWLIDAIPFSVVVFAADELSVDDVDRLTDDALNDFSVYEQTTLITGESVGGLSCQLRVHQLPTRDIGFLYTYGDAGVDRSFALIATARAEDSLADTLVAYMDSLCPQRDTN